MKVLNEETSKDIITDIKNMSDENFIKDLESQGAIYLGKIPILDIESNNKKHIFIINGSGGRGKDTFIECCSKHVKVFNISSVDKVKEACTILGYDENRKNEEDRRFLNEVKFLSIKYSNHPYNYVLDMVTLFKKSDDDIMFIHIREPEEINAIKSTFYCQTILINNINVEIITSNTADANVNNYNYDFVINNNGTLTDLERISKEFIKKLKSKEVW